MDHLPRSNEGFSNSANNTNNLYGDSQQFTAYDNLFPPGHDQNSYDASWGVNASAYPGQSRAPQTPAQPWQQSANHLSTNPHHANLNGQASPYARSLSHSPAPYGQQRFNNYGPPQNFAYPQPPQYDPALVSPHAYGHAFNYAATNYQTPNTGTVAPRALEHAGRQPSFNQAPYSGGDYPMGNTGQGRPVKPLTTEVADPKALAATVPNGKPAGPFSIIDFDGLAKNTKSERMGNFVNVGSQSLNWDINRAALPAYVPRKARSELRKIAGNDPRALSKLGKKKPTKKEKSLASTTKQLQLNSASGSPTAERIKYDGDSSSEESSSDSDSDSDEDSDNAHEPAPLPPKRPSSPKAATEFDTIKALWRGKRRGIKPDSIRKGIVDFWEIVKTIRDRWKTDSNSVTEAEKKNQENELTLLQSRVKDQRDMMETAFKAALKHGHRDIVELFSENSALLYACYQFLLDRFKADDINGSLARTILEMMAVFTTLTDEKMDKVHLDKVLPRFAKKGDAKTQGYAKRIISNAASTKKSNSTESTEKKNGVKEGDALAPSSKPEPVAGVKRAASTPGEGGAQKKVATTATKSGSTLSSIKQSAATKKPTSAADAAKSSTTTVTKPKSVTAKPSGLFAGLQSASKKPGTSNTSKAGTTTTAGPTTKPAASGAAAPKSTFSFAETMANLTKPKEEKPAPKPEKETPEETPEEKAKRLRKESRRNLRVQFKPNDELVQVRLFHHDPEEEIGHDASQMRDVSDVGGEGRMFKQQHQMMDIDDEEEAAEEEEKLVEFKTPSEVDFSELDPEERKRLYAPFGGGPLKPDSAECAVRDYYEANNLLVFYQDAKDIPPNPREPADPYNGEKVDSTKDFGKPEEKWAARAREKKNGPSKYFGAQQPTSTSAGFDLSKLPAFLNNQQQQPNAYQQSHQSGGNSSDAISNILASLSKSGAIQPQPPPPQMGGYNGTYAQPPPQPTTQPQQPSTQPDLAAILAQLTQSQNTATQAPGYSYNANATASAPNMMGYGTQPPSRQPPAYDRGGTDAAKKQYKDPASHPFYRTRVCKYWQEGRCTKGDDCSYKHAD